MSDALSQVRPMSLGDILNTTFNLYREHFKLFAGIAALVIVPEAVIAPGLILSGNYLSFVLVELLSLFASMLVTGAMAEAVSAYYSGRPLGIRRAYRDLGQGTLLTLLGVALASALLVVVGLAFLVIPGIYVAVRLVVSTPAAVVEKGDVRESLRRSWNLVEGDWWRVFGVVLVVTILVGTLVLILERILGTFTADALGLGLSTAVVGILVQPIQSIALVLLYFDLRARKEGGIVAGEPAGSSRRRA